MNLFGKKILLVVAGLLFASRPCLGDEPVRIVTTTTVLASIAEEVAGDVADIYYIASPKRDLHKVAPTPKDVLKTKKSDFFIYHGLQSEPWLLPLLNATGKNEFLEVGGSSVDASTGIEPLEVPHEVNRLEGDVHPQGNPHYWMDPNYAKVVAQNIRDGLVQAYPNQAEIFERGYRNFATKLDAKILDWDRRMSPFKGLSIVTYHRSWSYFTEVYDLSIAGEIEPKPGIPVTGKHLSKLISTMGEKNIEVIFTESYFNGKSIKKVSKETGAKVIELEQFVKSKKGIDDYIDLMEYNISQIEKALR